MELGRFSLPGHPASRGHSGFTNAARRTRARAPPSHPAVSHLQCENKIEARRSLLSDQKVRQPLAQRCPFPRVNERHFAQLGSPGPRPACGPEGDGLCRAGCFGCADSTGSTGSVPLRVGLATWA